MERESLQSKEALARSLARQTRTHLSPVLEDEWRKKENTRDKTRGKCIRGRGQEKRYDLHSPAARRRPATIDSRGDALKRSLHFIQFDPHESYHPHPLFYFVLFGGLLFKPLYFFPPQPHRGLSFSSCLGKHP